MSDFITVRESAWESLVPDQMPETIEQAIDLAGLNWSVQQKPLAYIANEDWEEEDAMWEVEPVKGYFANVRSDNGHPLGVVSKRYVTFDNLNAFSFLAEVFGSEMEFVAGGEFDQGKRVFVIMRIPDFIEVGGDAIGQYAFVHNSHDGKHAISVGMTPLRWLCKNVVTANLRISRRTGRFIAIRHSNKVEQKIEEARKMMDVTINYYAQFKELGDKLALRKPSGGDMNAFMETLLPIDAENDGERSIRNTEANRQKIFNIFAGRGEGGNTEGNAPGTWWALYNAAIEFADWYRPERRENGRLKRAFDDPDGFKTQAFELALGGAGL